MSNLRWLFLLSLLTLSLVAHAQQSDLVVTKTGPEQSAADTDVTYTVTILNGGPDDAPSVTLTDTIPAGMTFVSYDATGAPGFVCSDPGVGNGGQITCTSATLTNGSSAVFLFVLHIPPATADGMFFTNVAVGTTVTDPTEENNSATATTHTPFPSQSDVFVTKLGPSSAGPDTDVVYELTVGNAGPDQAASLTFSDTLPGTMTFVSLSSSGQPLNCTVLGETISCTGTNYPVGSTTLTITGHIPAGTASGTSFTNTATVAEDSDPNPDNNSATTTLIVSNTDLSVVKTGPSSAQAGDDLSYTITVSNAGPETAFTVQLTDPLPEDTTLVSFTQDNGPVATCFPPAVGSNGTVVCNWASLANGASAQFTLVITSNGDPSITNTATVTTQTFDSNANNNVDSVTTTLTPVADLSIVKSGPATVPAGADITYTLVVANSGPSDASGVGVDDVLAPELTFVSATAPAGWSCTTPAPGANGTISCSVATLASGASANLTFVAHVPSATTAGTSIVNTATVDASTADPDNSDNTSTTTATVTTALPTDVSISKTTSGSTFAVGATVPYTIVVTNSGTSDALDTVVTDTIPAGTTLQSATSTQGSCSGTTTVTCTVGTLAPSASATITITVVLPATPGTFVNTATATNSNGDTNAGNNASTATISSSAFVPVPSVPTLSSLALAFLGIAFAVAGVIALRGRL
ncbi:MAG: DUF11 domain-containing protein [Acidobacteriota bacterium]